MPCWYFSKEELKATPSFKDGIDLEKEARYRREGARFLMDLGIKMGLRHDTMATGVVFFHRFYMFHSFSEFPRYPMATCCLFLAGKVEETPKKCKDLIKTAKSWLEGKSSLEHHAASFGDDPIKEIMIYERILLQTIKFDLQVDHPYGYLLKYAKTLKGDQESIRDMVQMAWAFINDSYCTTLCLQWEPEIIAIALMYLTSKLKKVEINDWITKKESLPSGKQQSWWWEQFVEDLNVEILDDICHQFLDLYQQLQQQHHGSGGGSSSTTPSSDNSSPNQFQQITAMFNQNFSSFNSTTNGTKRKASPSFSPKSTLNATTTQPQQQQQQPALLPTPTSVTTLANPSFYMQHPPPPPLTQLPTTTTTSSSHHHHHHQHHNHHHHSQSHPYQHGLYPPPPPLPPPPIMAPPPLPPQAPLPTPQSSVVANHPYQMYTAAQVAPPPPPLPPLPPPPLQPQPPNLTIYHHQQQQQQQQYSQQI